MVYILNKDGKPLMPTKRRGKVRHLLETNKAKVVKRTPFTIQLLYDTGNHTQEITLGVDAGSKMIGLSAVTEKDEVYSGEVECRNDIVKLLSQRRESRNARRNRKTRYRKARFNNRRRGDGWLAPSIKHKINTHLKVVEDLHKILPISKIIVETASFDIQKIKNPQISGTEYQHGEMLNFWNTREYVLFRDGNICQCCKGKSKDNILNVHHIESRHTGGNAPNNLITLCETCHKEYHQGKLELPKNIKRGTSFKDATFMGIMRWAFYDELKRRYPNVKMTYGYITKNTRIANGLPKEHRVDARCITGRPNVNPMDCYYFQKKVRCHNRQLHKTTIQKGGIRRNNQAEKEVFGFRLFDKVLYQNQECFIFGRRSSGYFDIRLLTGEKLSASLSYKKLKLIKRGSGNLIERRVAIPPHG